MLHDRALSPVPELPPHTSVELKRFFEDYKKLEQKEVLVKDFLGKEKAYKIIEDSILLYKNNAEELKTKS